MDDTYSSKSKVRRHVEIVFRNMRQDSQNQLRQMLSWIAIFKHFGGVLRDVHGLAIKPKRDCRWDLVSLGEVMLRFDPGARRISTARTFEVCEGGGEYNVARGLKRSFGMESAIVTAFASDPVGRLLQDLIYQGRVELALGRGVEHQGIGDAGRNGINFTERGFGVRAAVGSYDR